MSRGAEDASGGGRHIGRRKMHLEAEEASEAEAEFEMERRGGRGFPLHPVPYGPPRCISVVVVAVLFCHGCAMVVGDDSDRLWMW